jgi:hypothetical protein
MLEKISHNLRHKLSFWRWFNIRKKLVQYGLPFLIILILWEIIEDIVIPGIFGLLGAYIDPMFYALVPTTWFVCLHPIAVPIMWAWWCFIFKKEKRGDENL